MVAGETREIVLQWETEGVKVLFHRGQTKKKAASQVEQMMRNEECYSDVVEEAKEGEEKRKVRG